MDSRLISEEKISGAILRDQVASDRYARIEIPGRKAIQIGTRPGGEVISATRPGEQGEKVTVQEPKAAVTREVGRTLLIIAAVALLAIVAAVLLAVRQANRLASRSPTSRRPRNASARATPAPATSGTACRSWTVSPTSSTPPPSASGGC